MTLYGHRSIFTPHFFFQRENEGFFVANLANDPRKIPGLATRGFEKQLQDSDHSRTETLFTLLKKLDNILIDLKQHKQKYEKA